LRPPQIGLRKVPYETREAKMTPQQTKLVAQSFESIKPRLPEIGAMLYAKLFEIAPDARALFKGDMKDQEKKLMLLFSEFVRVRTRSQHFLPVTGDRGQAVIPGIGALHQRHVGYGVQNQHYGQMREAMMWALTQALQNDFPPDVLEAWSAMFDMMAKSLRETTSGDDPSPAAALGARLGGNASDGADLGEFFGSPDQREPQSGDEPPGREDRERRPTDR
jgi:hemoglobin-like flavoprotein